MANTFFYIGRRSALGIRSAVRTVSRSVRIATRKAVSAINGDGVRRVGIVTIGSMLVGSFALPTFAATPSVTNNAHGVQLVRSAYSAVVVTKDPFKALSAAQAARQGLLKGYPAYTGPSVADFLKNPPYPNFELSAVFAVAKKYIGVPYRYGGDTPAGFDCSGFVQFVYSQFGVALPHSSGGQASYGKPIRIEDAKPGDIVIMPGHNGIYAGNGKILDAPQAGGRVSIRPLWTSHFYIIRVGI